MIKPRGRGIKPLMMPEVVEGGEIEESPQVYHGAETARELVQDSEKQVESANSADSSRFKLEEEARDRILHARRILVLEGQVKINPHYKTLFTGLKLNHPDNVTAIYPATFLLRRVLYGVAIVGMTGQGIASTFLLLFASLGSLCYLAVFRQWKNSLINL